MAQQQQLTPTASSSLLDTVPLFVVVLLAVHVFALVYWMYKLASDKPPPRTKTH